MRRPGESFSYVILKLVADAYGVSQPTVSRIVAQHRVLST
jgi:DNA-binding LacI/PurR family transcriptional regulator